MLLTKAELELAKLASKEKSRYALDAICVETQSTTVTDGTWLVTVEHGPFAAKDYPLTEGLEHKELVNGVVKERVLINSDAALAAVKALPKKNNIPVLGCAALGADGKLYAPAYVLAPDGKLYVNDLESVHSFDHKAEGTFPVWQAVIPTGKPKIEFAVNARYLRQLADYIEKHSDRCTCPVRVTVYDAQTAIRFDSRTVDGQNVMALLMPLRLDSDTFAKRPHEVQTETQDAK